MAPMAVIPKDVTPKDVISAAPCGIKMDNFQCGTSLRFCKVLWASFTRLVFLSSSFNVWFVKFLITWTDMLKFINMHDLIVHLVSIKLLTLNTSVSVCMLHPLVWTNCHNMAAQLGMHRKEKRVHAVMHGTKHMSSVPVCMPACTHHCSSLMHTGMENTKVHTFMHWFKYTCLHVFRYMERDPPLSVCLCLSVCPAFTQIHTEWNSQRARSWLMGSNDRSRFYFHVELLLSILRNRLI